MFCIALFNALTFVKVYLPKNILPKTPEIIIKIIVNIIRFVRALEIKTSGCISLPTNSFAPFLNTIILALQLCVIISDPSARLISKLIKPSVPTFSSGQEFKFPAIFLLNESVAI